jgi:uncharacterized protein (TIGR03437 family)
MQFCAISYVIGAALACGTCVAAGIATNTIGGAPVPSTSVYRQPVIFGGFVQTVPAGQSIPAGAVNLLEGANVIATAALDSRGAYSMTVDSLPAGRHTLVVLYVPTGNYVTSSSPNILQVVNPAPTSTILTVPSQTALAAQVITFSAAVAHSPPSTGAPLGSVTFLDGATPMATVPVPSTGPAVYNGNLTLGLHSVSAVFNPSNGNALTSTSPAVALSVGNTVAIKLASNPPSPALSQPATLVATVTGASTPPTGTVQFLDGQQSLGTAALNAGQANIQATFNTVGSHSVTVTYNGDATYLPAGATFTVSVGQVQSTVDLNTSATNVTFGQPVTLTSQIGPPLSGVGAPAGQVTFFDGSNPVGSATPSSGLALLTLTTLSAGRHVFTAYYAGDANRQPAQSPPVVITVGLGPTLTNVTLTKSFAQQAALTAQVNVLPPSQGMPTGSVQFVDSITKVVLGSAALSSGIATASINLQGANPISALYVGDNNFAASTSIPANVVYMINAAGNASPAFAPDELIAIFGSNLARQVDQPDGLPLPRSLGSVTVDVIDAGNVSRSAALIYVSPSQVNALLPAGMAFGPATLNLTTAYGLVFPVQVTITPTAPGIFTANSDGRGVPAATILRVKADGTQIPEAAISFDSTGRKWVAVPIDVSTDSVYLLLYGTGIRNISGASSAPCLLNSIQVTPAYAGAQPGFPGLDQVNVLLPAGLSNAGTVTVQLTVNGQVANPVTIVIK